MTKLALEVIQLKDLDGYKNFTLIRDQIKFDCVALCSFCDSFILVSSITKENNEFIINNKVHLSEGSFIYLMPLVKTENLKPQDNGVFIPFEQDDITGIFINNCLQKDGFWIATTNEKNLPDISVCSLDAEQATIKTQVKYDYVWIFNWPEIMTNTANFFGFLSFSSFVIFALKLRV